MRNICHQLWRAPVLHWDGKKLGCCRNFWGDFGANAFREGFAQAVNSEKMNYAREMRLGNAEPRQDIPCVNCSLYDALRENGNWLSPREVSEAIRDPGILLSVVVEAAPGASVGVFLYRGRFEGRLDSLTRSLPAASFTSGKDYAVYFAVPEPAEYTICAIPARPSSGSSRAYDWKRAAQRAVQIPAVPICQEIEIRVK